MNLPSTPKVVVDAGAYTGISTAYFALAYPQAQIIAVEPNPASYRVLLQNTKRFRNVTAICAGLWSSDGELMLCDRGTGAWGFSVVARLEADSSRSVRAISVQTLMNRCGIRRIDVLKLDIEGAEKDVLEASAGWISRVGCLAVELHDRFEPGCSKALATAAEAFESVFRQGEKVLCLRTRFEESREDRQSVA